MREEVEGISRRDRVWMASMRLCRKCSGCHQMPERSFFLGNYQLPLCARCTGIVIGHLLGVILGMGYTGGRSLRARETQSAGGSSSCGSGASRTQKSRSFALRLLCAVLPLIIDGTAQEFTPYESTNGRRLCTGILYGFGMMSACIRGIRIILRKV